MVAILILQFNFSKFIVCYCQHRAVVPDQLVAVDTGGGGRDAGERRLLDRGVAVPAVDAQPRDMVVVAERHRLSQGHALARVVGRPIEQHEQPDHPGDDKNRPVDAGFCDCVRAALEDLRHAWDSRRRRPKSKNLVLPNL